MAEKLYRIGEAADLLKLKTYVLRFWESEFPQLQPVRTAKDQRLYSEETIALLRRIRYLLHEKGMTIDGARRVLMEGENPPAEPAAEAAPRRDPDFTRRMEQELRQLRRMLLEE